MKKILASNPRYIWYLAVVGLLLIIPYTRHFVLYNALPLFAVGYFIYKFCQLIKNTGKVNCFLVIFALCFAAVFIHYYRFGPVLEFDSKEYLALGKRFFTSFGEERLSYRPPLYAFIIALFSLLVNDPSALIVLFQHMLVLSIPLILYRFRDMLHLTEYDVCLFTFLIGTNSLVLQSASYVMSEIVFMFLVCVSVISLIILYRKPSLRLCVFSAFLCLLTHYARQMILPIMLCAYIIAAVSRDKRRMKMFALHIVLFALLQIPLNAFNLHAHGFWGTSSHLGVNIFTKVYSFKLEKESGKHYQQIKTIVENVEKDLDFSRKDYKGNPEGDWVLNRVPHVVIDSMMHYHGYTYREASTVLKNCAVEGMIAHPFKYAQSIGSTFKQLLLNHNEMYPEIDVVIPVKKAPAMLERVVRGIVHIHGIFILLGIFILIRGKFQDTLLLAAVCIVAGMYILTASVHVGLTRYTVPWVPYAILIFIKAMDVIFRDLHVKRNA